MNAEMVKLISKLEALSDWAYAHGGVPPAYKEAVKQTIVRLVAMDAQIVKLQAKLERDHGTH